MLPHTIPDVTAERIREKLDWVREGAAAAGRDFAASELNALVYIAAVTADPAPLRAGIAQGAGMDEAEVAGCPNFLIGSGSELREQLEKRREETGISYYVIQGRDLGLLEEFAEHVIEPLAGR